MEFEVDRFAGHTGFVGLGEVDVEGLVYGGAVGDGVVGEEVVTEELEVGAVVSVTIACVVKQDLISRYLSAIRPQIMILV